MHGVDVRRPFVDVDLWEFFLSLRAEVKFPDTRSKTLVSGACAAACPTRCSTARIRPCSANTC